MLRPDPSIDFLAFSLPDAISSALSGLPSLVVRSTAAASRFAGDTPDIPALAGALDVDVVVLGTLLSSGQQVRVSAQLVQAAVGNAGPGDDLSIAKREIFQLQDALAKSIVESLSLSLTAADRGQINRDAPANAEGYELLPARQRDPARLEAVGGRARSLSAVPRARSARSHRPGRRLGRCYRLLGKYGDPSSAQANLALAEDALKRALDINPDLSLAHNLYAHVEVDAGRCSRSGGPAARPCALHGHPSRNCSRAWCTPAGIAVCSTPRWPRTSARAASTPP